MLSVDARPRFVAMKRGPTKCWNAAAFAFRICESIKRMTACYRQSASTEQSLRQYMYGHYMAFVGFVPSFCLGLHATDDSFNSAIIFAREVSRTGGVKLTPCLGRYENLFILRHLAQDMTARRLQRSVVEKCPRTLCACE